MNVTAALANSVPTTTTGLLTLLLSEDFGMSFAALFLLALLVLALLAPIFWLSRPKSAGTAKLVALGLGLLPIWFGGDWISSAFGYMDYGWLASSFYYLPLVVALLNLLRTLPIIFPENKQQGGS